MKITSRTPGSLGADNLLPKSTLLGALAGAQIGAVSGAAVSSGLAGTMKLMGRKKRLHPALVGGASALGGAAFLGVIGYQSKEKWQAVAEVAPYMVADVLLGAATGWLLDKGGVKNPIVLGTTASTASASLVGAYLATTLAVELATTVATNLPTNLPKGNASL